MWRFGGFIGTLTPNIGQSVVRAEPFAINDLERFGDDIQR
jgi:hypothetical protein